MIVVSPFMVKELLEKRESSNEAGDPGNIACVNGGRIATLHRRGRHSLDKFGQEAYSNTHSSSTAARNHREPNEQLISSPVDPHELSRRHHCRHGLHRTVLTEAWVDRVH